MFTFDKNANTIEANAGASAWHTLKKHKNSFRAHEIWEDAYENSIYSNLFNNKIKPKQLLI